MPNNPSELARLEEEYEEAMATVANLHLGKSEREKALTEARQLAKILGYNNRPYNGYPDD